MEIDQKNLTGRLRSVAAIGLRGASIVLAFVVVVLLTRLLGPEGYGQYALIVALITVLNVPVGVALSTVLMREVSEARATQDWSRARGLARRGYQCVCALAAIAAIVVLCVAPGAGLQWTICAALAAVALSLDSFSAVRAAQLRGLNAPLLAQAPDLLLKPAIIALGLGALYLSQTATTGVVAALTCLAIGAASAAVMGWLGLIRVAPSPLFRTAAKYDDKTWRKSALALAASSLVIVGGAYADTFVLAVVTDAGSVGVYRVAAQVALATSVGYTSLNYIVAPQLAYHAAKSELVELARISGTNARWALALSLIAPVLLALTGPTPLMILFGPEFTSSLTPLMFLLLAQIVNAAMGFSASCLLAMKMERYILLGAAAGAVVSSVGTYLLAPSAGPSGAACAAALGLTAANAIYVAVLAAKKKINPTVFNGLRFTRR